METSTHLRAKIGARINTLRLERGLGRQQDLADAAGLSMNTISRLERGQHDPTLTTLIRIARALGVPVEELVKEES